MPDKESVIETMSAIFRDILERPAIHLAAGTTAADVEGWDSLTHIQMIVAIEKHFKVRFKSKEIVGFADVGEMADAVLRKMS
jgi:acyl carrier protein